MCRELAKRLRRHNPETYPPKQLKLQPLTLLNNTVSPIDVSTCIVVCFMVSRTYIIVMLSANKLQKTPVFLFRRLARLKRLLSDRTLVRTPPRTMVFGVGYDKRTALASKVLKRPRGSKGTIFQVRNDRPIRRDGRPYND